MAQYLLRRHKYPVVFLRAEAQIDPLPLLELFLGLLILLLLNHLLLDDVLRATGALLGDVDFRGLRFPALFHSGVFAGASLDLHSGLVTLAFYEGLESEVILSLRLDNAVLRTGFPANDTTAFPADSVVTLSLNRH